jgi:hypothetical protein
MGQVARDERAPAMGLRDRYCCRPKLRLIVSCPLKSILDGWDPKEHSDLHLLKSQLHPSSLQDYELFIYPQFQMEYGPGVVRRELKRLLSGDPVQ